MQIFYVHGLGRSPETGAPMLTYFSEQGFRIDTLAYNATRETIAEIIDRLLEKIHIMASKGPYFVVGHSFGGILLRLALAQLPNEFHPPETFFLLGSPTKRPKLAKLLGDNCLYDCLAHEAGEILNSDELMNNLPRPNAKYIVGVAGISGLYGCMSPFGEEPNDAVVTVEETRAEWFDQHLTVPVIHTYLPRDSATISIMEAIINPLI